MSSPNTHQSSLTARLGEDVGESSSAPIEHHCSAAPETRSIDKSNEVTQEARTDDSGSTAQRSSSPASSSTGVASSSPGEASPHEATSSTGEAVSSPASPSLSAIHKESDSGDPMTDAADDAADAAAVVTHEVIVDGNEKDDTVADLKEIVISNSDEQVVQCEIAFNSQDERLALCSPNQQLDEPSALQIDEGEDDQAASVSGDLYSSAAKRSGLLSKSDQVNALSYIITTTIRSAGEQSSAPHNESKSNLNSNESNSEPLKSDGKSSGELSAPEPSEQSLPSSQAEPCSTADQARVSTESSKSNVEVSSKSLSELRSEDYLLNSSPNNAAETANTDCKPTPSTSHVHSPAAGIVQLTSPSTSASTSGSTSASTSASTSVSTSANKRKHSIEQLQIVACRKSARLHELQAYHSDNSIYLFEPLQRKRSPPIDSATQVAR